MQYWAHNSLFQVIFRYAETFRCSPQEICEGIGLEIDQAMAVDGLVPASRIVDAIEWCAKRSGQADFGLRLGALVDPRVIGLPALLAEHSRSVEHFYDLMKENLSVHTTGYSFVFSPRGDAPSARLLMHGSSALPARHFVEAVLVVKTQFFRRLLGTGWRPSGVEFSHERLGPSAAYEAAFGAPVTFRGPRNALLFSVQDLLWRSQLPYYKAKPAYEAHLRDLVLIDTHDHVANVTRLIRALLPSEVRVEDVAAELRVSPRSLQRKLAEQGASFTSLLTQARVAMAQDYLRHPGVTITEVADKLGFSNVSTLSRLLRRELGETPSGVKATAYAKAKKG